MNMRMSGGLLLWGYGLLIINSFLWFVYSNVHSEEEWLDPYDMLNYDSTSQSMRKPAESSSYSNVPTKRREYSEDSCQMTQCPDIKKCTDTVNRLEQEIEEHRRRVTSSQKPTCNPVFKRFLAKLLKEIEKLGLPTSVTAEKHYDAEVKLSKKMVAEIQKIVNDESSWRTGALNVALSQILINFKLHDYEAWKWRFEDTFGVEPDTVIKVSAIVLIIVGIICTEMWSVVSWFVQFKRMFAICFIISLVWNWFYLYKIAFAEHQANVVKMETVNDKCTGLKKIDWVDNFKEWFRTALTLQDDPCEEYYKVLFVNPILLVPPTKAVTMTIATFFTDPLKHIGQGISEFLRALLKDLPVTLQIPVLLLIGLSFLVFIYSTGQAAVQHTILRPLRGGHRDPPPGIAQQPVTPPLQEPDDREEEREQLARGDADRAAQPRHRVGHEGNQVNRMGNRTYQGDNSPRIHQRRPNRPRAEQQKVYVETLRNADSLYSGDETGTQQEAAAEAQHVEEEPQTVSNGPEEKEACASNTEVKHTQTAFKEHSAKSDTEDNKASGNTEQNKVGDSASIGGDTAKKEDFIENIGTPVRSTMQ